MHGDTGKLIAILRALDFRPSVDKFEDKIVIQKVSFLLDLKGVATNFGHSMYVRGPYAPDLTVELYQKRADFQTFNTNTVLTKEEQAKVQELKELFGTRASLLEIAATYAYFIEKEKLTPLEALKKLKAFKSFFTEAQIAVGVSKAKQFLFMPSEKEIEEMNREFKGWNSAGAESWGRINDKDTERRDMAG